MPRVPLERAYDFRPTTELRLGSRTYTGLPLSLGRFLRLCAVPSEAGLEVEQAANAMLIAVMKLQKQDPKTEDVAQLGRVLAQFPPEPLHALVCEIIPEIDSVTWSEHGGIGELVSLGMFLYRTHDWDLIGVELGEGQKDVETPSRLTVATALHGLALRTGRKMEELLAMRVEGFFYFRRSVIELAEREKDAEYPADQDPHHIEQHAKKDPAAVSSLLAQLEKADAGG
jgi:hypothetical protein